MMPNEEKVDDIERQQQSVTQTLSNNEPYSIHTVWQKRNFIFAAAIAAFFSPMSASIYMPALTTLAKAEHVSNTLINLTVTSYLVSIVFFFCKVLS